MKFSPNNIWLSSRDYVIIVFGLLIYAFGFCAFVLPEKVVIGGLVGVGSIGYFLTGIPVAVISYGCNLTLLAIAYKVVGKQAREEMIHCKRQDSDHMCSALADLAYAIDHTL